MYAAPSAPINQRTLAPLAQPPAPTSPPACPPNCDHDHSDPAHSHSPASAAIGEAHAGDIASLTIPLPILPDADGGAFATLVRSLLWDGVLPTTLSPDTGASPDKREFDILRSKGFLLTEDGRAWVLQGVREVYEVRQVPRSAARAGEAELEPKLVLIGKGLSTPGVKERFLALLNQG